MSAESWSLYEILKAETKEVYEIRFLEHKKEILDAVKGNIDDIRHQIKDVAEHVDTVHADVSAKIAEATTSLGAELSTVRTKLSAEITQLSSSVNQALQAIPQQPNWQRGGDNFGPNGHQSSSSNPGKAYELHTPPPGGGTNSGQKPPFSMNCPSPNLNTDASVRFEGGTAFL